MTDGSVVVWFRHRKIRPTQLWVELSWVVAISLEDEGKESDSDDLEDYETEVDDTGDAGDGTLRVNCVPTNGSMVIIRDLSSWLRSPYIWRFKFSHI